MVFIKDHAEFIFDFNFIRNVIFAENENLAAGFPCFVQNTPESVKLKASQFFKSLYF